MMGRMSGSNAKRFHLTISNLLEAIIKLKRLRKFGVHAFFEDKHDNAVDIHEELDIPVILFDTPYNRKPIPDGVIRVYDWQEANQWIKRLFPIEKAFTKETDPILPLDERLPKNGDGFG